MFWGVKKKILETILKMLKKARFSLLIVFAFLSISSALGNFIYLLKVNEIINPASAGYIVRGID